MILSFKRRAKELSRKNIISIILIQIVQAVFLGSFFVFSKTADSAIEKNEAYLRLFVFSLVCFFLLTSFLLLKLGSDRYFFQNGKSENEGIFSVLYFFQTPKFKNGFLFSFLNLLFSVINFLLSFLPTGAFFLVIRSALKNGASKEIFLVFLVGLLCCFLVSFFFFSSLRRLGFLSKYYFFENEDLSFSSCLEKSIKTMKRKGKRLFLLKKSFIPEKLFCVFLFPTPFVWGSIKQSLALLALDEIKEK